MSWRDALRERRTWKGIIAGVVLIGALASIGWQLRPVSWRGGGGGPTVVRQWAYDLESGELSVVSMNFVPPGQRRPGAGPTGGEPLPEFIRAHVFSCDGCVNPDTQFIALIEKVDPNRPGGAWAMGGGGGAVVQTMRRMALPGTPGGVDRPLPGGSQIAVPGPRPAWVELSSGEGHALIARLRASCGGDAMPTPCTPEDDGR